MERSVLDTLEILSNGGQIPVNNKIIGIKGKIKREFESILNCKVSQASLAVILFYFAFTVNKNQIIPIFEQEENNYKKVEKRLTAIEIKELRDYQNHTLNNSDLQNLKKIIRNAIYELGLTIDENDDNFLDGLIKDINNSNDLNKKRTAETTAAFFGVIYVYLYTKIIRNIKETRNTVSTEGFLGFSTVNLGLWISGGFSNPIMIGYTAAHIMGAITVWVNERQKKKNLQFKQKTEKEIQEWLETAISLLNDFAQGDNPGFLYNFDGDNPKSKFVGNLKFGELLGINDDKIFNLSKDELFEKIFKNNPKEIKRAEKFIKGELEEEPVFDIINKDGEITKMIWNTKKLKGSGVINIFLSYEEVLKQRKVKQNNIPENTPIISKNQARKNRKIAKGAREKEITKNEKILAREMLKKGLEVNRISMILYDRVMKMKDPAVIYEKDNKDFLKGIPLFWNPAMEKITGYKFEEIKNKTQLEIMELLYGYDEVEFKRVLSYLSDMNSTGEGYDNTVFTLMTKKGRQIFEEIKKLKSSEPNNFEKIEELEKLLENEKIQIAWHADRVETGGRISIGSLDQARIKETLRKDMNFNCLNSRALKEDYNNIITVHNQENITDISKAYVSVAFCDVDNFKGFNDTYGHDVGDLILAEIIRVVGKNLRKKEDNLYRIGGDEFVVMLSFADNYVMKQKLKTIIETLSRTTLIPIYDESKKIVKTDRIIHESTEKALEYSKNTNGALPPIFTSWGISNTTFKEHKDLAQIKKESDIALYEAKNSGKNQVIVYEDKL